MTRVDEDRVAGLTAAACEGDRKAFSELVKMFMGPITALTYRMTGDREAANDLAQEAFVAAWQGLAGFRRDARFSSWLYQIASNKTLNHLKREKRRPVSLDDQPESAIAAVNDMTPEDTLSRSHLREEVLAFMEQLPPQQRAVFELRFYKEMPFEEIARVIGKAEGTVKTHYRQAVIKLREYARERGWKP